jgi:hypothetical protein
LVNDPQHKSKRQKAPAGLRPAEASASRTLREELTMPDQTIATELKPLRLNFAQWCIWCSERWCDSPKCVAKHERSFWIVCPECDGTMQNHDGMGCCCAYGLVEATRPGSPGPDFARLDRLMTSAMVAA